MTKKRAIFQATSFFKDSDTSTTVNLTAGTSWCPMGVVGDLNFNVEDALTPKLRQLYIVTVEPIALHPDEHPSVGYKRILAEADKNDEKTEGVGRKFRD